MALASMRRTDESLQAFINGELPDHEVEELRRNLSSGHWADVKEARRRKLLEPIIEDMKARWPNGTVLYLKGGSPKLVVDWCRDDGMVSVCWFDTDFHVQRDSFPPELLQTEAV